MSRRCSILEICTVRVGSKAADGIEPIRRIVANHGCLQYERMSEPSPVYVFRPYDGGPVFSAAPLALVVTVYGDGGLKGEAGLEEAFGGSAYFRDDDKSGPAFLGVWGTRNASRFRSRLRQSGVVLEIIRQAPPARLRWYNTGLRGRRPDHPVRSTG